MSGNAIGWNVTLIAGDSVFRIFQMVNLFSSVLSLR
jgi:hypothetical protein